MQDNKCKISAPTWNEKLELFGGLYSVTDINHYKSFHQQDTRHMTLITYPTRSMKTIIK